MSVRLVKWSPSGEYHVARIFVVQRFFGSHQDEVRVAASSAWDARTRARVPGVVRVGRCSEVRDSWEVSTWLARLLPVGGR